MVKNVPWQGLQIVVIKRSEDQKIIESLTNPVFLTEGQVVSGPGKYLVAGRRCCSC